MTTTAHNLGRHLVLRLMLAGLAGAMAAAAPPPVAAQASGTDAPSVCARVRATGPAAARLLERGIELSGTFRHLVAVLEQSDLIVHVETAFRRKVAGVCLVRGETRVAAWTPRGRFLRITLSLPDVECNLISTLGHELQHAVEIASAPDVTDDQARIRYYRRFGVPLGGQARCTVAAQEAGARVLAEVRDSLDSR